MSIRDILDLSPSEIVGRLINVGLQAARRVGVGLGLVNELRDAYPDVPLDVIGNAVQTVGSGILAANEHTAGSPDDVLNLDIMPVLPGQFFKTGETGRVAAFADVTFESTNLLDSEGEPTEHTWDVRVDCSEVSTFQELIDCIAAHFEELGADEDYPELNSIINRHISVFFMGKRF